MNQVTGLRAPAEGSEGASAPETCRNMIAVASGKGGVGKTWLAITLSHALGRAGRRTLLFDGDLGLANVDIQLGLAPTCDLGGVLAGRYTLGRAAMDYGEGGFEIIAGRSGTEGLASLPAARLATLTNDLVNLAADYHTVVLDLGGGVDRTVRQLAARAGTRLVVTTDEPTSLTDAYAFIKLSLKQDPRADLRIVVNMAESKSDGERTHATLRKACDSFLKASPPLAGIIRRDGKVKDSIRNQAPILTRHPNATAAQDVEKLARQLVETT